MTVVELGLDFLIWSKFLMILCVVLKRFLCVAMVRAQLEIVVVMVMVIDGDGCHYFTYYIIFKALRTTNN